MRCEKVREERSVKESEEGEGKASTICHALAPTPIRSADVLDSDH